MWYTVFRETGDIIDVFNTMQEAVKEVARYEERDQHDGTYTEGFYDVVNPTYGIFANGDYRGAFYKAILCADYCSEFEAEKHLKNGTRIFVDSPFGFAEFVQSYEDEGTAECYDEIRTEWESLSRTTLDGISFRVDYNL